MHDENELNERARRYLRALDTLRDGGEAGLLAGERESLREACDALLFGEEDAVERLREAKELCAGLVESRRWRRRAARQLLADVEGCADPALLAGVS
jgi:hypothetical protein